MNAPKQEKPSITLDRFISTAALLSANNIDISSEQIASKAAELLGACYAIFPLLQEGILRFGLAERNKRRIEEEELNNIFNSTVSFKEHLNYLMPRLSMTDQIASYRKYLSTIIETDASEVIKEYKAHGVGPEDLARDRSSECGFAAWRARDITEIRRKIGKLGQKNKSLKK